MDKTKSDTERWTMSQAVKLPRSCLLGLLIIPLTYYYISMYSYSSCDTFEDYQMGNFVQEVCISVFQKQKNEYDFRRITFKGFFLHF